MKVIERGGSLGIRGVIVLICIVLSTAGCRSTISMTDAGIEESIDESGKIPAKAFAGNPVFSRIRLSPSGRQITAMVSRGEKDALIAIDLQTGDRAPLALLKRMDDSRETSSTRIERVEWASEDAVILSRSYSRAALGARARAYDLFVASTDKPRLEPIGRGFVLSTLPDNPDRFLVNRGGRVREAELRTGTNRRIIASQTHVYGWASDHKFRVRVGADDNDYDNEYELWGRISEKDRMQRIVEWDPLSVDESGVGFFFVGFSSKPHIFYVISERETGRFAVYEYDIQAQKLGSLVFDHPVYEVSEIRTSALDGRLLSVSYNEDRPVTRLIDEKHRRLWEPIHQNFSDKTVSIVSTDRGERSSIFIVSADDSPPVYYRVDHLSGEYSRLFRARPALDDQPLSKTESIRYKARDGLEIEGFVTRPANADGPTAAIVFPHGGPFARTVVRWNSYVQFFASRGFTVFQLNHRGSTGYGRKFREAGYKELGRKVQDDITDGVRWLIAQGLADASRIGIFGIGYGGYAALEGLVSTPDLYAAGASYGGISDLVTLLDNDNVAYYGADAANKVLIGSRWTDRGYLREVSPAHHADKIRVPVLLGHGTNDWNYHIRHTDKMASALEAAGIEHEVYRYRGESHGFLDERTRIDFFQKIGAFFEKHLEPDPAHIRRPVYSASDRD